LRKRVEVQALLSRRRGTNGAELWAWTRANPGADEREFFKSYAPGFHQEWLAAVLNPPIPKVLFGGEEALITRVLWVTIV
jgi:hypothetical protein